MSDRQTWHDDYWKKLDKNTEKRLRSTCPRCGSSKTFYNKRFKIWRCQKCEHSFAIQGLSGETPWWKRLFHF